MTKFELRKIYLTKQKNLSPEMRDEKSRKISDLFFQTFDLSKVYSLHCFLPIERTNEIDTKLIFQRLWLEFPQIKTVVPRVNFQTHELENLRFEAETNLVANAWQIHEPAHDELIDVEQIDAILVPLLCFDVRGFRVGYGKGFYDKFLSRCRMDCLKIGLSYFQPVEEITDAQDFDVKLDFCVTPEKIFNTKI